MYLIFSYLNLIRRERILYFADILYTFFSCIIIDKYLIINKNTLNRGGHWRYYISEVLLISKIKLKTNFIHDRIKSISAPTANKTFLNQEYIQDI